MKQFGKSFVPIISEKYHNFATFSSLTFLLSNYMPPYVIWPFWILCMLNHPTTCHWANALLYGMVRYSRNNDTQYGPKMEYKKRMGPTLIQQIIHFNHNLVRADEHLIHDCVVKYAYVHVSYGVLFSWNEHSLHDRTTTNRSFAWWMHHKNDVKRTQPSYYNCTCQLQIFTFISWINNQFALTRTSQMDCIW